MDGRAWQSDTDNCHAGYPGTSFPADEFNPAFWPSRVPNKLLTEANSGPIERAQHPTQNTLDAKNIQYQKACIVIPSSAIRVPLGPVQVVLVAPAF